MIVKNKDFWIRPEDLTYTGRARFVWPDGRQYEGAFVGGRPHGIGTETLVDGESYVGGWKQGMRDGRGVLTFVDGGRYEGSFQNGERAGQGRFTGNNGTYTGAWQGNLFHGEGRFDYPDGSSYTGLWAFGQRNGTGAYERTNGATYKGEWFQDVPHGFGVMQEPDGMLYDGAWIGGERDGYGYIIARSGLRYEGTWSNDQRSGYGREDRPDGSSYEGEWESDHRNGLGVEASADGTVHEGAWERNTPLGPGTRVLTNDVTVSGMWNRDFVTAGLVRLPSGLEYAGDLYDDRNRVIQSGFLSWLTKQARAGDPHAALLLADAYTRFDKPSPDLAQAMQWYRRASSSGVTEAMYRLGTILIEGGHVDDGIGYLVDAAGGDHAVSALLLGTYHQLGTHVSADHGRALDYYVQAADNGSVVARNNLAWLLATSPRDDVRDGKRAIEVIEPIAYMYRTWGYFDTLAAAYASAGEFAAATDIQTFALRLAENAEQSPEDKVIEEMRARLTSYRDRRSYIDRTVAVDDAP